MNIKQRQDTGEPQASDRQKSKSSPWKWIRRVVLATVALALLFSVLAWAFLPRIAERLINDAIADIDLEHVELRVAKIGISATVFEAVSVADGSWALEVDRVLVKYDLFDLLNGKMEEVVIEGMEAELGLPDVKGATSDLKLMWVHDLPGVMEKLGKVRAENVGLKIERGGNSVIRVVDFEVIGSEDGQINTLVRAHDFNLGVDLQNTGKQCAVSLRVNDLRLDTALSILEVVLWLDEPLLPEGMSVASAELTGGLMVDHGDLSPIELDSVLEEVVYKGRDKRVKLRNDQVKMNLTVDLDGAGNLDISGAVKELSLPLDAAAGSDLLQLRGDPASWSMKAAWGQEATKLVGELRGVNLSGKYHEKAVDLDRLEMKFQLLEDELQVTGGFYNGEIKIPLRYQHTMHLMEGSWKIDGKAELGPVMHKHTPPVLGAAVDFFDQLEVAGQSDVTLDFSVGSDEAFDAKMAARLKDAELGFSDGLLKASKVNGIYQMQITVPMNGDQGKGNTSYHTLQFSAGKVAMHIEPVLGFNLVHMGDKPVLIRGKGSLEDDEASFSGELRDLSLYGEKGGNELNLNNIGFGFELKNDQLTASGGLALGGNDIPFSYEHKMRGVDDGWQLEGCLKIEQADLREPVENAVIFIEAMEGKTISGKVSAKMDFALGSEKDFEGSLEAGIRDGTLFIEDDGPLIEGIEGELKLDSLKQMATAGFQRVTAQKMTDFDVNMKDLGLEYQLLPNGDIKLRNIGLKAMDGEVSIDDFTFPGGDDDYAFKLRFRKLDVAQLAGLFPDFSGNISGLIDGLLPMESSGGKLRPGRGGMYLTPKTRGKLRYDAGNSFSAGLDPKTEEYKRMKMVEQSLRDLDLKVLSVRLFDPADGDKAVVLKLQGQAPSVEGSPPIHLNINGFKPDDETVDFFDLLLRHRDRLDFGL